jgi:hypothetical protein
MTLRQRFLCLCAAVLLLAIAGGATAQNLEPRAFSPAPVGLNFALLGYNYSEGNVLLDQSVPVNRRHSLKFIYVSSLSTRIGTDFDKFTVFWQTMWGG